MWVLTLFRTETGKYVAQRGVKGKEEKSSLIVLESHPLASPGCLQEVTVAPQLGAGGLLQPRGKDTNWTQNLETV